MYNARVKLIVKHKERVLLTILIIATLSLRLINLGYSEYMSDEPGTFYYRGYGADGHLSKWEFLLKQRKGPMQIFVGLIPYYIVGNYENELAQRLPFALAGSAAMVVFYFVVKKLTGNTFVAFVSTTLLSTNGLVVAYGRIAQYQNLNLLFSFAALYFYTSLREPEAKHLGKTLLGTFMFALSFLSHWDAVYILIPIGYLYVEFLLNKNFAAKYKLVLTLSNLGLALVLLAPFMIPYINYYMKSERNQAYLSSIVGMGGRFIDRPDLVQFLLYNPFITLWFYLATMAIGAIFFKKNYLVALWGLIIFLIFRFFINYSGLHFYNMFIPWVIICALGIFQITRLVPKLKPILLGVTGLVLAFFYYQSYLLFVDHSVEYPMESENILGLKTKEAEHSDNIRHRTGFPHKRYWKEINAFITEQNKLNNEELGYYTNEIRIDSFYMDVKTVDANTSEPFYAVGIKRPLSLQYDYKMSQIHGKHTVHEIKNAQGATVVKIYRVEPKTKD